MSRLLGYISTFGFLPLLGLSAVCAAADSSSGSAQPAVWQHHDDTMTYFATTSSYTCDGIEEKTRQVLLYMGARPDLKVSASCPYRLRPVVHALVHVDFNTLVPATAGEPNTLPAHWANMVLRPHRPDFMDMGECDFVNQLKGLLTKDFSLRDVQYDTACTAHSTTIEDYRVSGEVLQLARE